jgi:hypothetical protein
MAYAKTFNAGRGFTLSKSATLHLVDQVALDKELFVRKVNCEVPGCDNLAAAIIPFGICAFVCTPCLELTEGYRPGQSVIEKRIKAHWERIMAITASKAFTDAEDHVTLAYDGSRSILETVRDVAEDATKVASRLQVRTVFPLPLASLLEANTTPSTDAF